MANMSYCRFQNTLSDLRDCARNIKDLDVSKDEAEARADLIKLCGEILAKTENHPWLRDGITGPESAICVECKELSLAGTMLKGVCEECIDAKEGR